MKVTLNGSNKTYFPSVANGESFLFQDDLFMKIESISKNSENAVRIKDGTLFTFNFDQEVYNVNEHEVVPKKRIE